METGAARAAVSESGRARATGLQAAQAALLAQLEAWRGQLDDREYGALAESVGLWFDRERTRIARTNVARLSATSRPIVAPGLARPHGESDPATTHEEVFSGSVRRAA
jgi:hypothetical protein